MKYYLVAGEASGDLHGANLMKALKEKDPMAEFRFFGGDLMLAEGGTLVQHYSTMAYMGIVEVALNLRVILKNMRTCKEDIAQWQPNVVVLIDFPGFNMKIAGFAKTHGLLVCYYISPKVWAWNQKRVFRIRKVVDHLFCILPFEVEFYKQFDMRVDYVGNPLLDAVSDFIPNPAFKAENHLQDKPVVALLPGSRKQEISKLLPEMIKVARHFPAYQFVIAGAPSFSIDYYRQYLNIEQLPVVFNATYDLLYNAQAAIVASGTATLETALFNVPQVVVYKANQLMVSAARVFLKIKYISLVNLITNKLVVKELIQENCNAATIGIELENLLTGDYRIEMLSSYQKLYHLMGKPGASAKTAGLIMQYISKK